MFILDSLDSLACFAASFSKMGKDLVELLLSKRHDGGTGGVGAAQKHQMRLGCE